MQFHDYESRGDTLPDKARTTQRDRTAKDLLTTKEVATFTGLSTSYFEKGRIYGYGPKFIRTQSSGKAGKILYRRTAIETWLAAQECDPEATGNV